VDTQQACPKPPHEVVVFEHEPVVVVVVSQAGPVVELTRVSQDAAPATQVGRYLELVL
jgi:hypothetical protein